MARLNQSKSFLCWPPLKRRLCQRYTSQIPYWFMICFLISCYLQGVLPPMERPWSSPVPPFVETSVMEVTFPADDEEVGEAVAGWRGPNYEVSDTQWFLVYQIYSHWNLGLWTNYRHACDVAIPVWLSNFSTSKGSCWHTWSLLFRSWRVFLWKLSLRPGTISIFFILSLKLSHLVASTFGLKEHL